ncbi:YhcN/YlaJ family sporulation lipoprotein [Paenibacillus swuensis]|uniref:YhcN/YlaJ family sporulation lipoprotein n=1 Tax=Paenibacillus swuensis TaxID=1178515 RepID=UPI000839165C|nr:YhcN/YlaJ family sporulation lipoprotein [Paenibacillus swuensis]
MRKPTKTDFTGSILSILSITLMLSACNHPQKIYMDKKKIETYSDPGSQSYGTLVYDPKQHDNKRFEYSGKISQEVASMDGVSGAIVMLTERNAYVAVIIDDSGLDIRGDGAVKNLTPMGSTHAAKENQAQNWHGRKVITDSNSYYSVENPNNLAKEFKQKIANKVRALSPHVLEVHISANHDYVNTMAEYAKEGWLGHDTKPLVKNFNKTAKYYFLELPNRESTKGKSTPLNELPGPK